MSVREGVDEITWFRLSVNRIVQKVGGFYITGDICISPNPRKTVYHTGEQLN